MDNVGTGSERVATFEEEGAKEAPSNYILDILQKTYPNAKRIENVRDQHIGGIDWIIHWKTGNTTNIDDKNDLWLGYTGNINLDEKTLEEKETTQLFVNTDFIGKYIFIFNHLYSPNHLKKRATKKLRALQEWGDYTYSYVVSMKELKHKIYEIHPKLVSPSFNWFCRKRKKPSDSPTTP